MKPTTTLARALSVALLWLLLAVPVAAVDSDGDGLHDGFERRHGLTSPSDPDSDGDGVVDSAEDHDGDGLGNRGEQKYGTHPGRRDSDGDGRSDGNEDRDRDGRSNAREQDQRPLPKGVKPSLRAAHGDRQPDRPGCQSPHRSAKVTRCVFGDPAGAITVTLVGDSNMTMYLTPFKRIAKARGWRLEVLAKSSCPAFLGMHGHRQWTVDKGATCRRWRRRVVDRLNSAPPDYLVYAHVDYRLVTMKGATIPAYKRPGVWRESIKRTLRRLPAETKVLTLGTLPANRGNPVSCLTKHPGNMSKCVTRRVPAALRRIDRAIRRGTEDGGGQYATLYSRICSYDPCPVVQGDVLVWRDGVHISETFAKRLQPSIASIVDSKLVNAK